jgi:hypothetical protein
MTVKDWRTAGLHWRAGIAGTVVLALAIGLLAAAGASTGGTPQADAAAGCRIYVASGDNVTNGDAMNENDSRYPEKLLEERIKSPGWCLFNQGKNGQTSASYIPGGGFSSAYNMRPDFLTLQLAEQNATVVKLITECFDKVKDHDFAGASACGTQVLANTTVWNNLKSNYTTILSYTKIMASQRPGLVIAVVNYPNPYPQSLDVIDEIALLCVPLIDTAPTCAVRWAQLPPALEILDQAFQKMNQTLKDAMVPFQAGPNGSRWVYADAYPKFKGHCMTMKVTIKTVVTHPPPVGAHPHDSPEVNFGCDPTWFVEGTTGTAIPNYLDPPIAGVLTTKSQTTKGMGVYPNDKGHKCIADVIWEADTIHPGTTPLKWLLGYGEASNTDICQ